MSGEAKLPRGMDLSLRARALSAFSPGSWNGSIERADAIEIMRLYDRVEQLEAALRDAAHILSYADPDDEAAAKSFAVLRAALDGEGTKP